MSELRQETRVDVQAGFTRNFFAPHEPGFGVRIAAATHPGHRRPRNEDHYAVVRRTRGCEMLASNLPDEHVAFVEDHAWGILVADGIGGARFGDLASQLAIETVLEAARDATSWVMRYTDMDAQEMRQRVAAYVERIQEAFDQHARQVPDAREMGTTLTGLYVLPPHAIVTWIGDSRGYLYRQHSLTQITRDHTLAQALEEAGADRQGVRRFGNILINGLGASRNKVDVDVQHLHLEYGDRLLVCTDGLSDMVDHPTLQASLAIDDLNECCRHLVRQALEAGGRDNITLVIADIEPAE